MINVPTTAEKRPVLELVTEMNTPSRFMTYEGNYAICIVFPGIGDPIIFLVDFIQKHFPHLRVVLLNLPGL